MTKKIPLPSKEEFFKLYITDNLSKTQLTKYYKVGTSTIESWIRQFNIVKRATERIYQIPTKEDFFEQYHTNNLSITELCEYYKVPEHIIRRWAEYFNFSKTSKEIGEIRAKAFYKKHGVHNPSQLKDVKEKRKGTMLSTYGVDNIFKDAERIKKAYINKLGVNNPSQLKEVKKKKENTFLKHFGVSTPLQLPEIRQKQVEATKEKYGENGVLGNEEIKAKIKQSVQEKYGVDNVMQLKENKKKRITTNKKKYGKSYYSQTEESKNRIKETCLAKYGKDNYFKTEEFEQKKKNAILNKYGVDNYNRTQEFKTFMKLYHDEIQQKVYETKKKNKSFAKSDVEEQVYQELLKKFTIVDRQYRNEKYPFACDFYIPKLDLYVEYNGSWVHGGKPFKNSIEDIEKLKEWEIKAKEINFKGEEKKYYSNAIYVWTQLDPKKLKTFIENKLNYKIFYNLEQFYEWYNSI